MLSASSISIMDLGDSRESVRVPQVSWHRWLGTGLVQWLLLGN